MHNPCAVIPVYNHEHALPVVVAALHQAGLPCVLVDDASSPSCAAVMDQLAKQANTYLVRLPAPWETRLRPEDMERGWPEQYSTGKMYPRQGRQNCLSGFRTPVFSTRRT